MSNTFWLNAGKLVRDYWNHLILCGSCPCTKVPDSCPCWPPPCDMLQASYFIVGYSDSYFTPCSGCSNSGDPAWDGTFTYKAGSSCAWHVDGTYSINGKSLMGLGTFIDLLPGFYWRLQVQCWWPYYQVWFGKLFAPTPVGTYARTSGCDTRPTVSIGY